MLSIDEMLAIILLNLKYNNILSCVYFLIFFMGHMEVAMKIIIAL